MRKIMILLFVMFSLSLYCDEVKYEKITGIIEKREGNILIIKVENKSEEFRIAPKWFLANNEYNFKPEEKADIKYSNINGMRHIIEITTATVNYKFVDENGEFIWKRRHWSDMNEHIMMMDDGSRKHNGYMKGREK